MSWFFNRVRRLDWWLIGAVVLLNILGVVMMYGIDITIFQKQLLFVILGLAILISVAMINNRLFQNYAYFLYIFGIIILLGVLLFGVTIRGTTGWFQIGSFGLQPVELAKILLIIALARFFSDHTFNLASWKNIGKSLLIVLGYGALVLMQPDLGSMAVFTLAFIGMLVLTNIKIKQILLLFLVGLISISFIWVAFLQDYQQERILTFLDPSRDQLGSGYNVTQSIISVGSGKLLGRGLGLGTQSQLQFLPERETDFIFAVIAEELGYIGAAGVIFLIGVILYRLWRALRNTNNTYAMFIFAGMALLIFVQTLINVGMNIGILPVTGIPLPFISAGGSSLFAMMIGLGITQSCYIEHKSSSLT
ncbi:MAG: rod shape-determining protein RodA [bacterium]|nr:rod shape-determining protein RodA [bacterium]